jgi:succinoglycan biosynthesis protein ExoA
MSHDPSHTNGKVDVSVLVPVLNEERHIRESVAAMLAQRYEGEIEFLFMDGRSDDRTKAILEEMSAADPRIRVLDNPQQRTTFGLNIGL